MSYSSETATCRDLLAKYCVGNGLDLGFGGDPIVPHAICIDREPNSEIRAKCGVHPTHLVGDVSRLNWFRDGMLDWVYQSHVAEDALDTEAWLREWIRVLRPGGLLVTFAPDEQTYRAHCEKTGQPYNLAHVHANFGLKYVRGILDKIGQTEEIEAIWPFPTNVYSFSLVVRKK